MLKHLLFDNDGTLVDTEIIAVRSFLKMLQPYDFHMKEGEFSRRYTGLLERDILQNLHHEFGIVVTDDFQEQLRQAHHAGFAQFLKAIPGMPTIFKNLKIPKSMVSNAGVPHVEYCLRRMRIRSALDGHIFSAQQVNQPKPAPDVYHLALETLQLRPSETLAVEDSIAGVRAAAAAGIEVIGFLGAAHSYDGHEAQLLAAGAHYIAQDAKGLAKILEKKGVRV